MDDIEKDKTKKLEWTTDPPHNYSTKELQKAGLKGDGFYWVRIHANLRHSPQDNKWNDPMLCMIQTFGDSKIIFFLADGYNLLNAQSYDRFVEEDQIKWGSRSGYVSMQWYGPIEPPEFPEG